jgi:hypothetical protein
MAKHDTPYRDGGHITRGALGKLAEPLKGNNWRHSPLSAISDTLRLCVQAAANMSVVTSGRSGVTTKCRQTQEGRVHFPSRTSKQTYMRLE